MRQIQLDINEELFHDFAKGLLENLPEYSHSLTCTDWDYEKHEYVFIDEEEDKEYSMNLHKFEKALITYIESKDIGGTTEHPVPNADLESEVARLFDGGYYDMPMIDNIIQIACLGKVVYG